MSEKMPRCPRLFDYGAGADTAAFNKDVEETNKLSVEEMKKIVNQIVLWRLKRAYYSQQELEKFAEIINVPVVRLECATRLILTFLSAYFKKKMDKDTLIAELQKGGLSSELIEASFDAMSGYSTELEKSYKSPAVYGAGFEKLYWRIDLKLEDTKRHDKPEYRILMELVLYNPGKEESTHVFFEMDEDDVFLLTSCLTDIVSELGKQKKIVTA